MALESIGGALGVKNLQSQLMMFYRIIVQEEELAVWVFGVARCRTRVT